ncbi:Ribonuclease 3-like protein 2 [Acorus calamus]|uniref:Ribonuclease 3-like protein 2 n=1 Tax=Acorus calamus TaxID=4465 RepID=A0AAV9DDH8_ACOCL|nr:Ribonuclease 3-like protein 2 [Acorus calamus]
MFPSTINAKKHEPVPGSVEMAKSMAEVEELLGYEFKNRRLLEEALTHSSHAESPSYQRLEFVGDAALGLAITKYLYLNNPDVGPGRLTILRAANIRNERLARVAVRHGLYRFLRRNSSTTASLDEKVRKFAAAIESEVGERLHCPVKAPKVLADIIESVAAAVYVDCDFDLDTLWEVFKGLLEPLITMETLHEQSVTTLCELCQKLGKVIDFKNWMKGEMNMINVFIDGELIGIGCSEQKEIAKVLAAKDALEKLWASDAIVAEADEVAVSLS